MAVRREYNLAGQFEEQTPILLEEKSWRLYKGGRSHNRMCSENHSVTFPPY
jgi:hypothetical protein